MTLRFSNSFELRFAMGRDDSFLGIGLVQFDGTPLRTDRLPWSFYTESETKEGGWRFETFRLQNVRQDAAEALIVFTSEGQWLPRIQAADAMGDARIKTRRLQVPTATFRWRFRPIMEKFWDKEWTGLAMQLEVDSPGAPLHWIIEDATWEIGGEAEGCVLIQQDVSMIDLEQKVEKKSAFSTIERFYTDTEDAWGGNYPMDMLPRAAGAAICDFQAKDDLALCIYAPAPSLTRARLEKFADEPVIHYTDRAFVPLTEKAIFPERHLLVCRHTDPLLSHERRNLWLDCFTSVRKKICDRYGFTPEIPRPALHSHLWDDHLKILGKTWTFALKKAFPQLEVLGFQQIISHGVWESITSDPAPTLRGNICCPYNFRFAEAFGGASGMKDLVTTARAHGFDFFQWFSFHISRASPIWKEHPDWLLREANGDPWDGNYGDIWSGRMRSDYGRWFEDQVFEAGRETGLSGIFWDSYQNLGVTCVDWRAPDKAPQAEEIFAMQSRLQRQGFKQQSEIVTIFGVSRVGTYGFENDRFRRRLWDDTVRNDDIFAMIDTSPAFFTKGYPFVREKCSPEVYFWMAGHRVVPAMGFFPWRSALKEVGVSAVSDSPDLPGGELAGEYARVNYLYNAALPQMHRLRLQSGGGWTLWLNEKNQPAIAWAFRKVTVPFRGGVRDLATGKDIDADGEAQLMPGGVYQLTPVIRP